MLHAHVHLHTDTQREKKIRFIKIEICCTQYEIYNYRIRILWTFSFHQLIDFIEIWVAKKNYEKWNKLNREISIRNSPFVYILFILLCKVIYVMIYKFTNGCHHHTTFFRSRCFIKWARTNDRQSEKKFSKHFNCMEIHCKIHIKRNINTKFLVKSWWITIS